ncbi:MAG: SBBP repeat-containing protein [Candidatus Sulfotelmatobacter sp.]
MRLTGAKSTAIRGENMLPGMVNYITGSDPRRWRTGVETYGRVRYDGVYPGIDLVFYGNQGRLEFDFLVAPRANVNHIRIALSGISGLQLDAGKDLVLRLGNREVTLHRPVAYQEIDGVRRSVDADFRIGADNSISFALGKYDASRKLVIDPILTYSTYLGGDFFDAVRALAVDQSGNAYVVGVADSCDFPTTQGTYEPVLPDCTSDSQGVIFVTKVNPQGTGLVYSTFVTNGDLIASNSAQAIALDESGNVYVAGQSGAGLPVTSGVFQSVNRAAANGGSNGFVFKLNPTGSTLLYSSYIGGSFGGDSVSAIAIDADGEAYLAGTAMSTDFPTTTGAFQTVDATPGEPVSFVSKVNASGSALLYSTYLAGNGVINAGSAPTSQANGIAVDSARNAYVVGTAADEGFPVTPGAFQTSYSTDPSNLGAFRFTGYVTKLNATGAQEVYSSFLGGSYTSGAEAVVVDSSGNAYVTGWTAGGDITTPGAFQTVAPGFDAYVVKINPSGSALTYATYLGGSIDIGSFGPGDVGFAIAVDSSGDAYIAGQAVSPD